MNVSKGTATMIAICLSFLMVWCLCPETAEPAEQTGPFQGEKRVFDCMHARIEILIPEASGSEDSPKVLADLAEAVIRKADALFSPFGESSDVRRLNSARSGEWVRVDPLTVILVREALKWHRITGGRFDPTIGPLKKLFKFERNRLNTWPTEAEISAARKKVGAEKLRLDVEGNRLSFAVDGMALDLGAIAKGFAADLAAEALQARGVGNALINCGGEMRILGRNPGPPPGPWKVALVTPGGGESRYLAEIENRGVASSGNYESYFEYEGKRYSHIINPLTGMPLEDQVAGVTVVHPGHATVADAVSTVFSILGPDEAERFLRDRGREEFPEGLEVVLFTVKENRELETVLLSLDASGQVRVSRP